MAFDQNSVPVDLRPINVARVVPDEPPRIVQSSAAPAGVVTPSPNPTPIYYPLQTRDAFGNNVNQPAAAVVNWYNPQGMPVGCTPSAFIRCASTANLVNQASNRVVFRNDSGEDLSPGKKLKFLCSFGGKILPRPGSGVLRYVGGHTRLIGFKGNVDFNNLVRRMAEMCGQAVTIKYQLPGEDLDALVSVACQEDFDIMMEEYDKVIKSLPDDSAKLRLYLFLSSEVDNSALAMLSGLNDSGQKYFEAVNGIHDEAGGMVSRKDSLDSSASAPSSDLAGIGTVDCSVQFGHGIAGLQTTGVSSQENTPRAVATGPLSSNTATASVVRFGIPAVASSVQISNTDIELDRPVLPIMTQNMAFEPKQVVPTSPPYIRVCVPQPQDIKGAGDSTQLPSQIVLRPSLVGTPGPLFPQQHQLLENAGSASPKQLMPAMSTSGTPQVVMRPNTVQQLMNSSQVRRENFPERVVYPLRVVPLDPSYCAYPSQAPQSMAGGAYGWSISTPNRPVGLATPQQILYTSNIARLDDCYMCQKSLPHAHSDSIAQQLKDGKESPTSDSNRGYQSLRSDINMQTQPSNMALTSGGSDEVFDDQPSGMQSRARNQADNQTAKPLSPLGVPQNIDTTFEHERIAHLAENVDHTKLPVSVGCTPCCAPLNNMVQQQPNISIQQYSAPSQFQAKQNAVVDAPMHSETLPTGSKPLHTIEPLSRESPKGTSGTLLGTLPQDDISELSIDSRWKSNQSTEALRISSPENVINTESGKVAGPLRSNMLDQKQQQRAGSPILMDCINKPNVALESNLAKPTETLSCFSSGVPYNISQPTNCYTMPLHPISGYANETPPMISAQKDDASQFLFTESFMSNSNAASCIMPSIIIENALQDSNPVFSNHDPLIEKQDVSLPPPEPSSITSKNETSSKDPFGSAFLKSNEEVNTELWLEDAIRLPQTSIIPGSNFEHVPAGELIKQELQAVTEGVEAFSLHAAAPPPLNANISSDAAKGMGEQKNDSELQMSSKSEDIKAKLPEKSNLGFPTSDLGRLQIINNMDLEELSELGSGTFGTVYHGKWRGTDVAIKRINDRCFQGKPSEQERMRDDFWNEAIKLADLHHPNVVAFYGIVLDGPGGSVATVTEYMVNGSLRSALQRNERNLDKRKRILIAMDVAFGMEYLHGKNIVHFDLKSDNLLVNLRDSQRPICKVGDLGLSKVKCHTLISGGVRGTLPWMAPELLNGSSSLVSEKVDVFSFGIVLWELITGEEPYSDLHYGAIIGGIVSNTLRPSVPESCDPEWRSLMEQCWSSEPSERPSFTSIANQLRVMASKIPTKGQK